MLVWKQRPLKNKCEHACMLGDHAGVLSHCQATPDQTENQTADKVGDSSLRIFWFECM